jgi:hypothetical protein
MAHPRGSLFAISGNSDEWLVTSGAGSVAICQLSVTSDKWGGISGEWLSDLS